MQPFIKKYKLTVSVAAMVIIALVYFYRVYSLTLNSDQIGLLFANILKEKYPVLKKDIPFGSTLNGCSYLSLRKCIGLQIGLEIHQKPEMLVRLAEAMKNPCSVLAQPELGDLIRDRREDVNNTLFQMMRYARNKEERDKIDRMFSYWQTRSYFDCDSLPSQDRAVKKLVLNVIENLSAPSTVIQIPSGGAWTLKNIAMSYQIVTNTN